MPLLKSGSPKAFKQNVRTEMQSGKPQDQALAIAYAVKRRTHKAQGGNVKLEQAHMAEGGEVSAADAAMARRKKEEPAQEEPMEEMPEQSDEMDEEAEEASPAAEDVDDSLVGMILRKRKNK